MALEVLPLGAPGSPTTPQFRQLIAALLGAPEQTFAGGSSPTTHGGAHGVVNDDDFKVTAQGSPNLTVNVAKGYAFIHGTSVQAQGDYLLHNDATEIETITPDATLDRIAYVLAQVRDDAEDSSTFTDNRIFVEHGTPSGTPTAPAVPAGCLVLAQVYVSAGTTAITSGNISDRRTRANALGGVRRVASTAMPTAPGVRTGDPAYQYDTDVEYVRTSAGAWLRKTPKLIRDGVTVSHLEGTLTIQYGSSVVATNVNGDANITYTTAFVSKPSVALANGDPNFPFFFVLNDAATTTSIAPFRAYNHDGTAWASGNVRVNWQAIGYVA